MLSHTRGRVLAHPDVSLSITRPAFYRMIAAKVPLPELLKSGEAKLAGDPKALAAIFTHLEEFDPLFNIVTP